MKPSAIPRTRILAILPLLLLGAQRAPDCDQMGVSGSAVSHSAIATGQPIRVEEGAVLAEEAFRYAEPAWRTTEAIRIPAPGTALFPAGTPVYRRPIRRNGGPDIYRNCLPELPDAGGRRGRAITIPCLVDNDGDGLHDGVERWTYSPAMHVILYTLSDSLALPNPQRLEDDPAGIPASCRHAQRRLKFGLVSGDSVWIDLLARENDCGSDTPRAAPTFTGQADGDRIYVVPPPAPPLTERAEGQPIRTLAADRETVRLVDGGEVTVFGLRLRIERDGEGWTMTPLDAAFTPWLEQDCD